MRRIRKKILPVIINALFVFISYFIIITITTSWIKRSILFVLAIDVIVACNILYTLGIKRLLQNIFVRKKYIVLLIVIEVCCLWMCIYKYLTINNNPIYLEFQYMIYLIIMSVTFWFFIFVFVIGIKYWKLYPILGLSFGLVFMLTIPIYVVPDEPVHLMTAYKVSNQILKTDRFKGGYLYGRADDMEMPIEATGYNLDHYVNYLAQFDTPLKENNKYKLSKVYFLNTFQYQYYLSGLGITIGRLLNFGSIKTFILGRLFNLIFFVSVITLAIFKTPKGKLIMMVLALTPISLQQGMSYSYDAIVIPLCFLIAALSLKIYTNDFHKIDFLILGITSALLIPTKQFAYVPYALIPWFYLLIKKISFRRLISVICIMAIAGIGCYMLINQNLFPVSITNALSNRKYVFWAKEYSYSILSLIKDPILLLRIIAATVYQHIDFYFDSLIGKNLGWFEITLPIIYPTFISLITLAVIFDKDSQKNSKSFWLNALLMTIFTIIFIFMGMLMAWTPRSYIAIEGVQGRYLIAVLPLLLIYISDIIKVHVNGNQLKPKLIILLLISLIIATDGIMVFMNR